MHADQWFIDIGVTPTRQTKIKSQLLKFWMPVEVETETLQSSSDSKFT